MVKVKVGDDIIQSNMKVKIRLDYKGECKPKFLFGNKNIEKLAEEQRDKKVTLLRNVPLQGVTIEDIDLSTDIYTIFDEEIGTEIAYAPVQLTLLVDSLEDILKFIVKEEFRKIEIIEPEQMMLTRHDMERLLFNINIELGSLKESLERKVNAK